jgi:hypothetical protein
MLRHGNGPISLWKLVNSLANAQNPDSRAHRRSWRLRYLCACRELLRFKVLYRHGGEIATSNFPTRPKPRSPRRLSQDVARLSNETGGSNATAGTVETTACNPQASKPKMVAAIGSTVKTVPKTQSAPAPELVSSAATALARLPRRPKIWSGWIGTTRAYRRMPIRLSSGEPVFAYGALRGHVAYTREPDGRVGDPDLAGKSWGVVPADTVQIVQNPHAVLLGRLKAGSVERRSELKAATARANGRMPVKAGARSRGRPALRSHSISIKAVSNDLPPL